MNRLERQLHAEAAAGGSPGGGGGWHGPRARELRALLQGLYVQRLLAGEFAVEARLWRNAFYLPFQDLKARLRAGRAGDARLALHRLLRETKEFYLRLLGGLDDRFPGALGRPGTEALAAYQKLLVCVGHLERYKQEHALCRATRAFGEAEWYYSQAAYLDAPSGNPHYQLAILAEYREARLVAAYRYVRALTTPAPRGTAAANLANLLGKVREEAGQEAAGGGRAAPRGPVSAGALKADFETVFLRAVGAVADRDAEESERRRPELEDHLEALFQLDMGAFSGTLATLTAGTLGGSPAQSLLALLTVLVWTASAHLDAAHPDDRGAADGEGDDVAEGAGAGERVAEAREGGGAGDGVEERQDTSTLPCTEPLNLS